MWVPRERRVQESEEEALKQGMLGVFGAQKEDLWLRPSTRGKERKVEPRGPA